jgi:putative PIN family toxin of toxin-antitoxin system
VGPAPLGELRTVRVVVDTNTVLSTLLFPRGRLAWIRETWTGGRTVPLVCSATIRELIRTLAYPKLKLTEQDIQVCLAAYLPFTEAVDLDDAAAVELPICRDADDQVFLRLAAAGDANVLVTGDAALLELAGRAPFAIETAASFKRRFE